MRHRKTIPHGITSNKLLFGYRLDDAPTHRRRNVTRTVQIVFSGALLIASMVVIFIPHFDGPAKQWAFNLTAFIVGFWLRKS